MQEILNKILKNVVWELVHTTKDQNIIGTK